MRISNRLTHTDPKAGQGAWVIALATRLVCEQETVNPSDFLAAVEASLTHEAEELVNLIRRAVTSINENRRCLIEV